MLFERTLTLTLLVEMQYIRIVGCEALQYHFIWSCNAELY